MENQLEIAATDSLLLRVRFFRQADRFSHHVALVDRGAPPVTLPLLSAVEGSDQQHWPPSPTLQDLAVEPSRNGTDAGGDPALAGHVGLLVGMAGKSHWALSVESRPGASAFTFDVACRIQAQPEWLGSCYALESEAEWEALPAEGASERYRLAFPRAKTALWIGTDPEIPTDLAVDMQAADGRGGLRIGPTALPACPGTARWRYHLGILEAGEVA